MQRPEQPVQISIVRYLRMRGFLFTAPDAGINVKSEKMRSIYKMMGRRSGVSDIIVWIPNGTVCIEVKRPKTLKFSIKTNKMVIADQGGRQSDEQKEFEKVIHNIKGHHYIVATSVEDVDLYFKKNNILPS